MYYGLLSTKPIYLFILIISGREQADLTGLRLKELSFPYSLMVNSSMVRAKETADIIAKSLPDVPREECDMLREGAPIPPEPPIGHWKPEVKVSYGTADFTSRLQRLVSYFLSFFFVSSFFLSDCIFIKIL